MRPPALDHLGAPVSGPKRPPSWRSWERCDGPVGNSRGRMPAVKRGQERYRRGRVLVVTELIYADYRGAMHWQWLVSISKFGERADDETVRRTLADFDMTNGEEDNHAPGVSRAFFRLCELAPDVVSACECKETEEVVREPDGYTWSRERPKEKR